MLNKNIKVVFNDCSKEELEELGEKLRNMRTGENKISQQSLGDRMLKDRSVVSKIESGKIMPTLQVLTDVAKELGYTFSINFEKISNSDSDIYININDVSVISDSIDSQLLLAEYADTERKYLHILKEYMDVYSSMLEDHYAENSEDYYEYDEGCPEYYKNRLNFMLYIKNSNKKVVKDELVIYIDNPDCPFLEDGCEWDRTIYMSVTGIMKDERILYNIDLVKRNVITGSEKILFTCVVDGPINVLIAAENIKKAYLENMDLNTIDITNIELLKVPLELLKSKSIKRKDLCKDEIKKVLYYEEVIKQFEMYNNSDNAEHNIAYNFIKAISNSRGVNTFDIDCNGYRCSCSVNADFSYSLYKIKKNHSDKGKRLTLLCAYEVLEAILMS